MYKIYFTIVALIAFISCSEQQARKPISHSSGSFINESINRNKKLVAKEEDLIKAMIKKDSATQYVTSEKGFWYTIIERSDENKKPVKGDIAFFEYSVTDLYGNAIYSLDDTKPQTYFVDKQNIMIGLRNGIKLMNKGDKVKFVFPSTTAYGYHGDDNKIGTNQPIICLVTLKDIKKDETKTETKNE